MKTIAEKSLDWKTLEPLVAQYHDLIEKEVEADTHKLESFEEFKKVYATKGTEAPAAPRMGPPSGMNLKAFFEQRQKYLLNYKEKK